MQIRPILAPLGVAAVLSACSAPTLPQAERGTPHPGGAAFDGGLGIGSGGFVSDSVASDPISAPEVPGRSGIGMGSGG